MPRRLYLVPPFDRVSHGWQPQRMSQTQAAGAGRAQLTDSPRSRTFSWSDPSANAAQVAGRSGLELLRAMIAGELSVPPALRMLGVDHMDAEEGRVTVWMPAREYHYNPLGSVHGGVLATVLDTAASCAVQSVLPAGAGCTSQDLTVRFLRPVTLASGMLRCEGSVLSRGRRTALAEARLLDGADRLVAHATSTCLIFETG
jgi:uncharacterized protein (TIGR00369 family)